jgi:ABC-2 type transport system permease protein
MLRAHILAAAALCRRDMLIYFSYRGRVVVQLMSILVYLSMFYYISRLVKVHEFRTSSQYFSYVVVGIVITATLQSTLAVGLNLHSELLAGTFERLVCSAYGAVNGIASSVIFPVLIQLAFSILTVGAGSALFDMPIKWSTAPLAIPVALVGAALFGSIALIGAAAVLVAKQTATVTSFAATALALLGGVYFPISLLPEWGRFIAGVQPVTYLVGLMRHFLIGYPLEGSIADAVVRILGFLVVMIPIAYLALTQAVRVTRRRATLLEY